jgi:hypothetical protein
MHCEKMAVSDMLFYQRAVIEFLVKEANSAAVIYKRLPETKRQSMKWHHTTSPKKKGHKIVPSAGKFMGTVFWDSERFIMVDFFFWKKGERSMQLATFRRSRNFVLRFVKNV